VRTHVGNSACSDVVVGSGRPSVHVVRIPKRARRERPVVQTFATRPERLVVGLVWASDVPIERHRKVVDANERHDDSRLT
jgi:hypothetical protein